VQLWEKASAFDPALGTPFHWVLSIVRNRSIDRLRSRQRRTRLLTEFEAGLEASPQSPAASGHLTEQELGAVRNSLSGLPTDQRQAIEMAFLGGMTHIEIARELGEPLGTVKARIRRGMLKLREDLAPYL
jgi:RNA polymerase sigma-70 factor (ECF subfamily)